MAVDINDGSLEFSSSIDLRQFTTQINQMERSLHGLTQTANQQASSVEGFAQKAQLAIASYISVNAASNFIQDLVRVRGEFQQLDVAFTTMLQSKEKADKLMREVTEFAAATPFELQDVAGATKQLLAFGIGAESIKGTLRSLGDISAGIGAPLGEIAYLFGTIKTQGVALTQDVRQFAQRGIPVYEELAKVLGVSTEEVGKFISAGKVGFREIEQVFQNLTAEGSKFGGLMEAQSKTLTGQISNFHDAWTQMLNDIGQGQEGIFSGTIAGLTELVKNYQTVLDVLKVLVITYGSYKAAVIATTAVQAIATAATQGYTIAEVLRRRAVLLTDAAMKVLNKTMLTNPYVLVATGIAAIVASLVLLRKESTNVKSSQELLAQAQEKVGSRLAETEAKIRPLVAQLKDLNLTENQRLEIYNRLREIDPKIVSGLDKKKTGYQDLTGAVNQYLDSLRKEIALQTNKEALTESIKGEQDLQKQIEETRKRYLELDASVKALPTGAKLGVRSLGTELLLSRRAAGQELDQLKKELQEQKKVSEEINTTINTATTPPPGDGAKPRTLQVIEDAIKLKREEQAQNATTSQEYKKYQEEINALEAERRQIIGASKKEISAANALENQTNRLLEKRKDLLQEISDFQLDADRSGLVEQQTEIDKINDRYDTLIQKINEYNAKVQESNRVKGTTAQQIGLIDVNALAAAKSQQIDNVTQKQQAEAYKESLEKQKQAFDDLERYKLEVGSDKANELLQEQTKGFEDYVSYLRSELDKLKNDASLSGQLKKQLLNSEIEKAIDDRSRKEVDGEAKKFQQLLQATVTFEEQKLAILAKYEALAKQLQSDKTLGNKDERLAVLNEQKQAELDNLQDSVNRQSEAYKKLNQDILFYTREQLQKRLKDLKDILEKDVNLSPAMRSRIAAEVRDLEKFLKESSISEEAYALKAKLDEAAAKAGELAGSFSDMAAELVGVNDGLADTLNTMSDLIGVAGNVANAIGKFATGDFIGGIASTIKAVAGVFSIGAKVRESERKAREEIEAFQLKQLQGEMNITEQYRERQREQVKLNDLKLEGLKAEKELLDQQRRAVQNQYADILAQLQQQTFIAGQKTEQYGGFLGIGRKTRAVEIAQTLAGKTFDELEQLFAKGQLTGKAKELFEILQKLRQEGADIDRMLDENKRAAQELFTGTTADSIVNTIADGFRNGLRSAADFADNFEDLMRNAIINSLKFRFLEGPIKDLFEQFAAFAESGGSVDSTELATLQQMYQDIIESAGKQFDQLQQIAGINFSSLSGSGNALTGAIKGITEQTAEVLAGQFSGLRLTAMQQLDTAMQSLRVQQRIDNNTAETVNQIKSMINTLVYYYRDAGVKMK